MAAIVQHAAPQRSDVSLSSHIRSSVSVYFKAMSFGLYYILWFVRIVSVCAIDW